jgi:hypothetical protein
MHHDPAQMKFRRYAVPRLALLLFVITYLPSFAQSQQPVHSNARNGTSLLSAWKEFSSDDGGFKILFPKKPKQDVGWITVGKMPVKTHEFRSDDGSDFSVVYFDVPRSPNDDNGAQGLLVGLRNFIASETKGNVLSESPITLDGNPGSLLVLCLPNEGVARGVIVVTARRVFRLLAVTPKAANLIGSDSAAQTTAKYFESFKISPTINDFPEGEVDKYLKSDPNVLSGGAGSVASKSPEFLNGRAIYLEKPEYPSIARQAHVSGSVWVRVVVDEEGKVVAAQPETGPTLLWAPSVQAARKSRFSPTLQYGKPIKVVGTIVFNFYL